MVKLFTFVVMGNSLRISESEWKVMEVIWAGAPATSHQVVTALGDMEDWKPQTVKTLLARLVKKGALRAEAEGNRFKYFPVLKRQTAVRAETSSFLDKISRGSLTPMLAQMVKGTRKLSNEELDALKTLLEESQNTKGENS